MTGPGELELRTSREDFARLYRAEGVVYLFGGYDGSNNFGDVLMAEEAVRSVLGVAGLVPVLVVDGRNVPTVEASRLHSQPLRDAVLMFACQPGVPLPGTERLLPVELAPPVPSGAVLYGGGYLNERWGHSHLDMLASLQAWAAAPANPRSRCDRPVVMGVQVSPGALTGDLRPRLDALVQSAEFFGCRDMGSLERMRAAYPSQAEGVFFSGDDAFYALAGGRACTVQQGTITVHVSHQLHTAAASELVAAAVIPLRECGIGTVNLIAGHEDIYLSEVEMQEPLSAALEGAGFRVTRITCPDDNDGAIAAIGSAAATVTCSYHVALASLVAGVPAVLLAGDDYYREKHSGVLAFFELPQDLLVDLSSATPADLAGILRRCLNDAAWRSDLGRQLQRGALKMAAARSRTIARFQSWLHSLLDGPRDADLRETSAELTRSLLRLADLRRANNAMVADARRAIESAPSAVAAAASRAEQLSARLTAAEQDIERLHTGLDLSQQHIRNLEAALGARDSIIAAKDQQIAGLEAALPRARIARVGEGVARRLRGDRKR